MLVEGICHTQHNRVSMHGGSICHTRLDRVSMSVEGVMPS
jgi:hypothetical protein